MKIYLQFLLAASLIGNSGLAFAQQAPAPTEAPGTEEPTVGWQNPVDVEAIKAYFAKIDFSWLDQPIITAERKMKGEILLRKLVLISLEQGEWLVARTGLDEKHPQQVITANVAGLLLAAGAYPATKFLMNLRRFFKSKILRGTSTVAIGAAGTAATLDLISGVIVIDMGSQNVAQKKADLTAEIAKLEETLQKASGEAAH